MNKITNIISSLIGILASIKLPKPLSVLVVGTFAKKYKIKMSEAQKPLSSYSSVQALFTRKLKDGCRPLSEGIVSPVDGIVRTQGFSTGEKLEQVKGTLISINDLIGVKKSSENDKGKEYCYSNLYLSPRHYHRIHSPISGVIEKVSYLPGSLLPVNDWSVNKFPELFTQNERVVVTIRTDETICHVVMVGALNVGCIELAFDSTVIGNKQSFTNSANPSSIVKKGKVVKDYKSLNIPEIKISKGDELGVFKLGSTVLVILDDPKLNFEVVSSVAQDLKYGETIVNYSSTDSMACH